MRRRLPALRQAASSAAPFSSSALIAVRSANLSALRNSKSSVVMGPSAIADSAQIAESLDPRLATIIAMVLIVLILVIPVASVLISVFSYSLVVFVGTCLFAAAGLLASSHSLPAAIPVGIGLQLVGLLLAIGGVQSHRRDRSPSCLPLSGCLAQSRPL